MSGVITDGFDPPSNSLPSDSGPDGSAVINEGTALSDPGDGVTDGLGGATDDSIYTVASFRAQFPCFDNCGCFPDAQVQFYIAFAIKMLNPCRWGNVLPQAIGLFAAHFIALDQISCKQGSGGIAGTVVGLVTSASVDKVSYSRDVASVLEENAGHWGMTTYGNILLRFARMMGAGPIQVGVGGWFNTDLAAYLPQSANVYNGNGYGALGWPGVQTGPW